MQLYPSGGVPSGAICIWSGNQDNIPTGWALCDGNNGTPNLNNRFVLGYGSKSCNDTGGSETVILNIANLPSHKHNATLDFSNMNISESGNHTHEYTLKISTKDSISTTSSTTILIPGTNSNILNIKKAGAHTHSISGSGSVTIGNTGSGAAHNNMPPYYVLCYIMKL